MLTAWKRRAAEGDETVGVEIQFRLVADVQLPLAKVAHTSRTSWAKLPVEARAEDERTDGISH